MNQNYLQSRLETILRCLPTDDADVVRHALLEQHAAGRQRERQVEARWQMLAVSVGLALLLGVSVVGWIGISDDSEARAVEQKCLATLGIIEERVP